MKRKKYVVKKTAPVITTSLSPTSQLTGVWKNAATKEELILLHSVIPGSLEQEIIITKLRLARAYQMEKELNDAHQQAHTNPDIVEKYLHLSQKRSRTTNIGGQEATEEDILSIIKDHDQSINQLISQLVKLTNQYNLIKMGSNMTPEERAKMAREALKSSNIQMSLTK